MRHRRRMPSSWASHLGPSPRLRMALERKAGRLPAYERVGVRVTSLDCLRPRLVTRVEQLEGSEMRRRAGEL